MAFSKSTYKASLKAADLAAKAETNPANFEAAMDAKADAYADAFEVAVSQLESASGDVTVPGAGLQSPAGPVTGAATAALIAPGKIK